MAPSLGIRELLLILSCFCLVTNPNRWKTVVEILSGIIENDLKRLLGDGQFVKISPIGDSLRLSIIRYSQMGLHEPVLKY